MNFADQRLSAALMQRRADQRAQTSASSFSLSRTARRFGRWLAAAPARLGAQLTAIGSRTTRHA